MPLPTTVEALIIEKTGDLEVIQKSTIPFPKPEPGSIVIKVGYLGVNFIDIYYRTGLYKYKDFPAVLGKEVSGTIIALPTDKRVLEDETYKRNDFVIGGKVASDFLGAHATYISVPWKCVYPVPPSVPIRTAAASLIQGLTCVSFFDEAYPVKAGDTILVHTVAGGLGLLFAQLGRARGATVIGTTSTKEKVELAKANGAAHVILYKEEDTVKKVLEITNGEGVDAVFDGVGKDTFDKNFELIKRKGTIVSLGNTTGAVPPFPPIKLAEKNVKLLRPSLTNYTYTAEEAYHYGQKLFKLIANGTLNISIHKEYPFSADGAKEAHKDLMGGKTVGKLMIKIGED